MVNSISNAIGIIFPNSYDSLVPELVNERLMASIPFASRYRMVDFLLSSMVNSGIDNVSLIARRNYRSLMDHLGSGREWDLTRKKGGLNIIPPYAEKTVQLYTGRVEALASILSYLEKQKEKYVVMCDANIAVNFDFSKLIQKHIESGANMSVVYKKMEIPQGLIKAGIDGDTYYYTFDMENEKVKDLQINSKADGVQNVSLNIYVIDREMLIEQITNAHLHGYAYFERDFLAPQLDKLNVIGYEYDGYVAYISNIKSYFDENMKLLNEDNLDALFNGNTIYTKIRDDNPTRYINGSSAKNIMSADGCVIEGEVENSILFRGVKVEKGAKVKNCVLMQDTVIKAGASVEYIITDKNVTVTQDKEVKGTDTFPVYVSKKQVI